MQSTNNKPHQRIDKTEAREIIIELCATFHVKRPRLKWTTRARLGRYRLTTRTIIIGPNTYHETRNVLLHEFAHHLESARNGWREAERGSFHGPAFVRALHDVVTAHYDDPNFYMWQNEYKQVQKIAIARGFWVPEIEQQARIKI